MDAGRTLALSRSVSETNLPTDGVATASATLDGMGSEGLRSYGEGFRPVSV